MKKTGRKKNTSPEESASSEAREQFDAVERQRRRVHRTRQRIAKMTEDIQGRTASRMKKIQEQISENLVGAETFILGPTLEKISEETHEAFKKDIKALQGDAQAVVDDMLTGIFDDVVSWTLMHEPKSKANRPKRKAPSPGKAKSKTKQSSPHKAYDMDYRGDGMIEHVKKLGEENKQLKATLAGEKQVEAEQVTTFWPVILGLFVGWVAIALFFLFL